MLYYSINDERYTMKTVTIEMNIEQLNIIKDALKCDTSSNDEKDLLIDMVSETIDKPDSDIIYGYCY